MDALVCVVWSVALLANTLSLKASVPASNEAVDHFMTPKVTDPKEHIRMDLTRLASAPRQTTASTGTDPERESLRSDVISPDASTASLPTLTPILTITHANSKASEANEPSANATVRTDIVLEPESVTSPTQALGPLDVTPSIIPPRSTTITPRSSVPSSTSLSEEHQNSSQSTTSEMIPTASLFPPATTLKDPTTGSASLGKENQDGPSELDVGDEESDKVPSPSPLDPLLAGLISIFIISTALLSIMLFLKFRQQSSHPEFHRLQDLPMDDLLEDTPLSRYSY